MTKPKTKFLYPPATIPSGYYYTKYVVLRSKQNGVRPYIRYGISIYNVRENPTVIMYVGVSFEIYLYPLVTVIR